MRGKFTSDDAIAAAQTLAAYAIGLIPFVLIRAMTAPFFARGDTATPVKASLTAVAINIGFKIVLMGPLAQVGLAIATAIGAWVNLGLVIWFAARAGILGIDARLKRSLAMLAVSGVVMAIGLFLSGGPVAMLVQRLPAFRDETALMALAAIGAVLYGALILLLLGRNWLRGFLADMRPSSAAAKGGLTHCNKRTIFGRIAAVRAAGSRLKPKLFVPICSRSRRFRAASVFEPVMIRRKYQRFGALAFAVALPLALAGLRPESRSRQTSGAAAAGGDRRQSDPAHHRRSGRICRPLRCGGLRSKCAPVSPAIWTRSISPTARW